MQVRVCPQALESVAINRKIMLQTGVYMHYRNSFDFRASYNLKHLHQSCHNSIFSHRYYKTKILVTLS